MLKTLGNYAAGSYTFTVAGDDRINCVNLLKTEGISLHKAVISSDGSYSFTVSAYRKPGLCRVFDSLDLNYTVSDLKGLPKRLLFLLRRPGLIVGFFIVMLISVISSRVVWGFDVVGNTTVPDEEILLLLDDLGCGYGDYIPDLDLDLIHARFLAENENISWIAVNLKGNYATVEVVETRLGEGQAREENVFANIIAGEDAQIYLVKTEAGVSKVDEGTVVKKGELLISGVIDVREDRVRYEYAKGEVLAYVPRKIEVTVPFKNAKKMYTGRENSKKSIKFFKKIINLFSKGGIEYTLYDKIEEDRQVCLFGKFPLPLWINELRCREYEYVLKDHSLESTVSLAMAELRDRLDETLEDAELISNKVNYRVTDEAFVITYDMLCLTDISTVSEFTVDTGIDP